jgi:enamine deaminase RidA (YjgF/YER057c/UK114 family)
MRLEGSMERRVVNPWGWQDQFGFVQANEVSGAQRVLLCAGQASVGADGAPLHAGDMRAQVVQALDNLETVLRQAGFGLADVVRLNYYTTDLDAFFAAYDAITSRLSQAGCRPASTLLGVTRLAFPELLVEIEATAAG